ncbi:MAG: hypothetical protein K0R50_585 [Eubacterium sp.]|jgi:NAD-dependent SIR2 family protein deacetylase|nr:hypothetical protein [Eubacterium sp.]
MLFIFGWGKQTVKNHGPVQIFHCDHCNNDKYWTLYSRRTWFTLFFIPVIPYQTEHLMLCPICNHGVKLDNAKFNELKPIAQCNLDMINKKITQEQHSEIMKGLASSANKNVIEENNLSGKTETQINYLKQMKEMEEQRNADS